MPPSGTTRLPFAVQPGISFAGLFSMGKIIPGDRSGKVSFGPLGDMGTLSTCLVTSKSKHDIPRLTAVQCVGTTLNQVIDILKTHQETITTYILKFDQNNPFGHDTLLEIPSLNCLLSFHALSQKLSRIQVYGLESMSLTFENKLFGSPEEPPTFPLIYKVFGPTHPGKVDTTKKHYILQYPGISLVFPIPDEFFPLQNITELPLVFPDGSSPVLERFYITPLESSSHEDSRFTVTLLQNEGVVISFHGQSIHLGDTKPQILRILGTPEDKFIRHTAANASSSTRLPTPCIWNYFRLGMDLVFDGEMHTLQKILLHNNLIGHYQAGRYERCFFEVSNQSQNTHVKVSNTSTLTDIWNLLDISSSDKENKKPWILNPDEETRLNPFSSTLYYQFSGKELGCNSQFGLGFEVSQQKDRSHIMNNHHTQQQHTNGNSPGNKSDPEKKLKKSQMENKSSPPPLVQLASPKGDESTSSHHQHPPAVISSQDPASFFIATVVLFKDYN